MGLGAMSKLGEWRHLERDLFWRVTEGGFGLEIVGYLYHRIFRLAKHGTGQRERRSRESGLSHQA